MVFELLASLFQSILIIWFISNFNSKPYLMNKLALIFTSILLSVTLINDYVMPGFSELGFALMYIISLIYAILICNGMYSKAIISTCLIFTLNMLLSTILYATISAMISNFNTVMQGSSSMIRYIYVILANLSVYVFSKFILSFFSVNMSLDIKTSLLMFITSLITLVGLGVTTKISSTEIAESIEEMVILLSCIFVAINIILYILVGQIQKLQRKKFELQLINEKNNFEQCRLNDAITIWENIRRMRHDMKQHFAVIKGFLQDGKTEDCLQYVSDLTPNIDHMGNLIHSDNKVIDYLINSKLGHLEDTQIIISGVIGDISDIADIDFSCIIGNILDNAVEAVKPLKKRRIELIFAQQNSNRIIICRNTIRESVLCKNKFLNSTKNDKEEHGLGHKIVASIVERYDGMIDYFEEDDMFGVQIILPHKQESVHID